MAPQRQTIKVAAVVVLLTLARVWQATPGQLLGGSRTASGTGLLVAMSKAATMGSLAVVVACRQRRHLLAAAALVLVALSPTGFAYPLNLLVLALAVAQVALGRQARPTSTSPR